MATGTTPLAVQTLGEILGPCFLSAMGTAMYVPIAYWCIHTVHSLPCASRLFGINNLQVYFYFRNYKQDGTFQKFLVYYLWYDDTHLSIVRARTEKIERFLDTIHMAFVTAHSWHDLIHSFGNYSALLIVPWCVPSSLALVNPPNERKSLQDLQSEFIAVFTCLQVNPGHSCRWQWLCVQSKSNHILSVIQHSLDHNHWVGSEARFRLPCIRQNVTKSSSRQSIHLAHLEA